MLHPRTWVSVIPVAALVAACGARTGLPVPGTGGQGGVSTSTTASSSSATTASSSSSSGTGGGCTTPCECGLTCCGGVCVNEQNDIDNCGACGRSCVGPGPNPYCEHGQCSMPPCQIDAGSCAAGSFCCATECCVPGQLCCTVNDAISFTKCQDPSPSGTCDVGAPCTSCASPDTPIATPDGDRAIATLAVGDLVYSVERDAIVAVPLLVAKRQRAGHDHRVVEVALANGAVLRVSPRHPTADGRMFGDLAAGDHLGGIEVVRVALVPYTSEFTYDILPATSAGAYFAGGALIGSTIAAR